MAAIEVDGLVNARDLGGRLRRDGGRTPDGVFFRSENLDRVSPAGWRRRHELGIRTILDLRQPGERAGTGARPGWVHTVEVDLDGREHTAFWSRYWDNGLVGTALYFTPHLMELPHRMAAVLDEIATAPEGGVLVHCMGGRDRTGLVSMVLLAAAGVVEDEIVDDYLETVRNGAELARARGRDDVEPRLEELCRRHGTTTEGAFRAAVDAFDFAGWSSRAGLSDGTARAIRTWRGRLAQAAPA